MIEDDIEYPVKFTKSFYFAIGSFKRMSSALIVDLARTVLNQCIWPMANQPRLIGAYIGWTKPHARRKTMIDDTDADWAKVSKQPYIASFSIHTPWRVEAWPENEDKLWIDFTQPYEPNSSIPTKIEFHCNSDEIFGGPPTKEYQTAVVSYAKRCFAETGGATGYITYDYGSPQQSPYEIMISQGWADRDWQNQVRGYYWGNFLGPRHVELLGGQKHMRSAPAEIVEQVGDGFYLQIKEDAGKVTLQDVRKLKEFLMPVLPQRQPDAPPYNMPIEYLV